MDEIEKEHPQYAKRSSQWAKCRDVVEGADAIKAKGPVYLPRLPGQDDESYANYKRRAVFYEATGRTLEGLSGLLIGTEPHIEAPAGAAGILQDCDLMGRPFTALAEDVAEDVLTVGRFGLMVDHPPKLEGITKDQVEPLGMRPYVVRVPTENVINWGFSRIANRWKLSRIVIRESSEGEGGKPNKVYRELVLEDGAYHLKTWEKPEKAEHYAVTLDLVPEMGGKPLADLPFFFAGVEFGDEDPDKPPLLGMVELNLAHYLTSADKRHALFHCGLPTPIFAGFVFKEGETVNLGGPSGIVSSNENAKATYLEFTGQGIQPLKEELEALEGMMAKLGARMLAEDKKQAEAAETLKIRASGESSTLASVAVSVSKTLTQVLALLCQWGGWSGKVLVQLNTDFRGKGLGAQDIVALTGALQAGGIPLREYLETLMDNGAIKTTRTGDPIAAMEAELETSKGADGLDFSPQDPNAPPDDEAQS